MICSVINCIPHWLQSTAEDAIVHYKLGPTKLILCFTDYLPSQGDLASREKIKVYYEMICITKITMIAKYLEDVASVHSQLANSSHTLLCFCS